MSIDPDVQIILDEMTQATSSQLTTIEEAVAYMAEEMAKRTNELDADLDDFAVDISMIKQSMLQMESRLADLESDPEPDPDPERDPFNIYDTDLDGWDIATTGVEQGDKLWTTYGPDTTNETYGSGNDSKHRHTPGAVTVNDDGSVTLSAYKDDQGVYRSGALSTREMAGRGGFFGWNDLPEPKTLRFEATITLPKEFDALWPAWWLRGAKGAGDHEPDVLEVFSAQTDEWRGSQTLHSTGKVNYIKAPWPFVQYDDQAHTWWFEIDPPGSDGFSTFRFGRDDEVTVDSKDERHKFDLNWGGWDMILQIQVGGRWVGDPDKVYNGKLQNGSNGKDAVASWAPDYEAFEMIVHSVKVYGK